MFSLIGILIVILDIYVIYLVVTSSADFGIKLLWIIVVLLLPLIGPVLYFLLGPQARLR